MNKKEAFISLLQIVEEIKLRASSKEIRRVVRYGLSIYDKDINLLVTFIDCYNFKFGIDSLKEFSEIMAFVVYQSLPTFSSLLRTKNFYNETFASSKMDVNEEEGRDVYSELCLLFGFSND